MKLGKYKNSIMSRTFLPLLIFLIAQMAVLVIAIFGSGLMQELRNNSADLLLERTQSRRNYIESEMANRWSAVDDAVYAVTRSVEQSVTRWNSSVDDVNSFEPVTTVGDTAKYLSDLVLEEVYDDLINSTIKSDGVNGVFVFFGTGPGLPDKMQGLYFYCDSPLTAITDNIFVLIGSSYMRDKLNRAGYNFQSTPYTYYDPSLSSDTAFLDKPYGAALAYPGTNYGYLGNWSGAQSITAYSKDSVTYTVPLIVGGKLCGVLGVEVNLGYIASYLPSVEINNADNSGTYVLGIKGENGQYKSVVKSGADYTYLFGAAETLTLTEKKGYTGKLYDASAVGGIKTAACVEYINLYSNNTPFEQERWALISVLREDKLFDFADRMQFVLITVLISTGAVGIVIAILSAYFVSRPILRLRKKASEMSGLASVKLDRTKIYEVDALIDAVEKLSEAAAENSGRLSRLIELTGIPVGAFDLDKATGKMIFTDKFFEITGAGYEQVSVEQTFRLFLSDFERNFQGIDEDDSGRIYSFVTAKGDRRFVKLKVVDSEERLFGVAQDVTDRIVERQHIEHERDFDLLTGLYNRRAFLSRAGKLFEGGVQSLKCAAVVLTDLDNLKGMNDTYGHETGDEYIRLAALTLKAFIPQKNLMVSRMSGDEFLLLFYGYDDKSQIREEIKKLEAAVRAEYLITPDGKKIRLCCSGGAAYFPLEANDLETLIRYADFAMYETKKSAKGCFREFVKESYVSHKKLTSKYEELDNLLEKNLVDFCYQPIVDIKTAKILGYEALIRTEGHTVHELLSLARAQSKMYQIERLTWFNAMAGYMKNVDVFGKRKIFINSVPNQIMTDADVEEFEKIYGKHLDKIVLEFTEDEKLNDDYTLKKRKILERWGASFALDDFGTGYSSDAMLLRLNPKYVKMDMYIVREIDKNRNKRQLLGNMLNYMNSRGIKVIAEGVETKDELKTLVSLGVRYVQGYYLGLPASVPENLTREKQKEIKEISVECEKEKRDKEEKGDGDSGKKADDIGQDGFPGSSQVFDGNDNEGSAL